jgi:hypothetical protein
LAAGVESFASDYPAVAVRVLREWAERPPGFVDSQAENDLDS